MDELRYWQLKLFQLLHDPPNKPFHLARRGIGAMRHWVGHARLAHELREQFGKVRGSSRADLAATGADRPVLAGYRGRVVAYNEAGNAIVCHPLDPRAPLDLRHGDDTVPLRPEEIADEDAFQAEVVRALREVSTPGWQDSESLKLAAWAAWRRLRDDLTTGALEGLGRERDNYLQSDPLWEQMPADTRVPDHSIWDHTRMAAALAFLDTPSGRRHEPLPDWQEPCLLQVSLEPVQAFIRQSRKAQDLWVSSFLLADLAFHALLPVVQHYGPENVVHPDLRGNPRVDHWLRLEHEDMLPGRVRDPKSYSALLPNTFIAIVARGGEGYLPSVTEMGGRCCRRVEERWKDLQAQVLRYFLNNKVGTLSPGHERKLRETWEEQHRSVIRARWTAIPWKLPERVEVPVVHFGALPCQDQGKLPQPSERDRSAYDGRAARLKPWLSREAWAHYERTRDVFARTNLGHLQNERGFDYALTYHQLRVRHRLPSQLLAPLHEGPQLGEKCTLCGERTALGDSDDGLSPGRAPIEARRQRVREFWSKPKLDPERSGAERLCAVCTFKRFLVEADGADAKSIFNRTWAGYETKDSDLDEGGKVRVPFPSTSAIAAQEFLAAVVAEPSLASYLAEVCKAHARTELDKTQFPHALPRLAEACRRAGAGSVGAEFLTIEPQETIFPRALDATIFRMRREAPQEGDALRALQTLQNKSLELLNAAAKVLRKGAAGTERTPMEPGKRFAVIKLDGDAMGQLLLGDASRVATRWRDVIHPQYLEYMEQNDKFRAHGWAALLDEKRLMGPSLHAFVSRALGEFAHRVVPWVVEREYGGRLVYAGGDDVLALAPADDAVAIAARLQKLFSAAWVVDTQATHDAWAWQRPDADISFDPQVARERFQIIPPEESAPRVAGVLFPMLGRGASLSGGIAMGHFKTSLRAMLGQADYLVDEVAKAEGGAVERGSAIAMSYYTRSGPKYQVALRWNGLSLYGWNELGPGVVPAHDALKCVKDAFRRGSLPARLPYKLREHAATVHGALAQDVRPAESRVTELLSGLLRRELDTELGEDLRAAVMTLWYAGLPAWQARDGDKRTKGSDYARMTDGLLLARALAAGDAEDEET